MPHSRSRCPSTFYRSQQLKVHCTAGIAPATRIAEIKLTFLSMDVKNKYPKLLTDAEFGENGFQNRLVRRWRFLRREHLDHGPNLHRDQFGMRDFNICTAEKRSDARQCGRQDRKAS